ncbi:MAG: YeeE/YedE family protein [Thiotrichaceae bacterium]
MEIYTQILLWAFGLAVLLGIIANKTNFCTMGAISDVVNIGDTGRMRAWVFALGTAMLGVMLLEYFGFADMTLTTSSETSNPPYRSPIFAWPRHLLGGIMFGVGMTFASGCGNKSLLRFGGGNLKSIFVLLTIGLGAYLMIFTDFGHTLFLNWMEPANIDLSEAGIESQGLGSIISHYTQTDSQTTGHIIAATLGSLMLLWAIKSDDFRGNSDNIIAGIVIGLIIVAAWWVTTGAMGQVLLEEAEMMDSRPYGIGAQSFTFVQPTAHFLMWLKSGLSSTYVTFSLVAASGVIAGSLIYSLIFRTFSIEWFSSWKDFFYHIIGALLMGVGGVLAIGCTIGQAISGASTLALGSFVTFAAIVFGSALTMKIQYYQMVYEEEATFLKALVAGLADMRLLPNALRQLDKV